MWTGHVSYPEARRRLATHWAVRAADPVRGHPGRPSAALGRPSVGTSGQPSQLGEAQSHALLERVSQARPSSPGGEGEGTSGFLVVIAWSAKQLLGGATQ